MSQTAINPNPNAPLDALDFFRNSAGTWRSQRVTHHLAFRRAEVGESTIRVEMLDNSDPRIAEICAMHAIDPNRAAGGAHIAWKGLMEWDKADENHEGQSVMVIVPDPDAPGSGQLLRERGYAETAPVAGRYHIDNDNGMVLTTEYETMSSTERFWFPSGNLRMRTSTLQRFGGYNTATFCTEVRVSEDGNVPQATPDTAPAATPVYSALGW